MKDMIERRIQAREREMGAIAFRKVVLEKEVENIDRQLAMLNSGAMADEASLKDFASWQAIEEAKQKAADEGEPGNTPAE